MLMLRGMIATCVSLIIINSRLKEIVWDQMTGNMPIIMGMRVTQAVITWTLNYGAVKYLSLIYVGLSTNSSPLVVMIMSYYFFGERMKSVDIFCLCITLTGVIIIVFGRTVTEKDEEALETELIQAEEEPLWPVIGLFIMPFLKASSQIMNRKMKELDENSISIFINPIVFSACVIFLSISGKPSIGFIANSGFTWVDWLICITFSCTSVIS